MSHRHRRRVRLFELLLLVCAAAAFCPSATAQQVEDDERPVTVEANLISVSVSVTDARGRSLPELERNAFIVYDDERRQEIAFFASDDLPASVVVLFDLSGSITPDKMAQAREALRRFIEFSHPQDEFWLAGFSGEAEFLAGPTSVAETLPDRLTFREGKGRTALFDACRLALGRLRRAAHRRRAILLISDGEDNDSRSTLRALRRVLKEEEVLLYAVGVGERAAAASVRERTGRNNLFELAEVTGGRAFFPRTAEELLGACEQAALELRSQYQLAYRPTPFTPDGRWRRIKVVVRPPAGASRPFVRYKGGYYAKTQEAAKPRV